MTKYKKNFIALLMVMALASSISVTCFAKDINTSENNKNYVLMMNDHGLTTVNLSWRLTESYNSNGSTNSYYCHRAYVGARSSRADWDTPYSMYVDPICHINSSGSNMTTFNMEDYSSIYPSNLWAHYGKESTEEVTYSVNRGLKSRFQIQITGSQCLNPYQHTVTLNLK